MEQASRNVLALTGAIQALERLQKEFERGDAGPQDEEEVERGN